MHFQLLPTSLALLTLAQTALSSPAISTITMTASAAPTPTSSSFTSDSDFQSAMLKAHNFYREEHNASALTWNTTSATYATNWASKCNFVHSHGPTGENLAAGYANATGSVDAWGLERESYNWKKPGFSETTGHFTQLVWSNTTSVGCGRKACNGANNTPGYYVVCEYYPPGNVEGDNNQYFTDNVKKQAEGKDTDTVESGVTSEGAGFQDSRWGVGVLGVAGMLGVGIAWQ